MEKSESSEEVHPMTQDFKYSFKAAERAELSLLVYNTGFQKCPPDYGWGPGVRREKGVWASSSGAAGPEKPTQ